MKSLAEYKIENAVIERRIADRRRRSVRRLKQRIANSAIESRYPDDRVVRVRDINAAIDAWAAKELP